MWAIEAEIEMLDSVVVHVVCDDVLAQDTLDEISTEIESRRILKWGEKKIEVQLLPHSSVSEFLELGTCPAQDSTH